MAETTEPAHLELAELERRLRAADPAAVLAPPRVLRRVIKQARHLTHLGLQVPHRKSFVVGRDLLLSLTTADELGLPAGAQLPPTVLLLARPDPDKLAALPAAAALLKYWRLLFHARIDQVMAVKAAEGQLADAALQARVHRIGATEFAEVRAVLEQERFLLPPETDREVYREFAAVYLELKHFALPLLPRYFPSLRRWEVLDDLLAEDVDAAALLRATRLEGAPDPGALVEPAGDDDPEADGPAALAPAAPRHSPAYYQALLGQADAAAARGNVVRAALCRYRAAEGAAADTAAVRAAAEADLGRLAERLRDALGLDPAEAEDWCKALLPVLPRAAAGRGTPEGRLLFDLQKVCVDHERGLYSVDVVDWATSFGQRRLRRPLSGQREVLLVRGLRSALRHVRAARVADEDRHHLTGLIRGAQGHAEDALRGNFRPLIEQALTGVGIRPAAAVERVAFAKLVEELLDRVADRGFLTMGDLRDAIARSRLKLPDIAGLRDFPMLEDRLLLANNRLADSLDGVYRHGEIYLRLLQGLSAFAFGTRPGRFLNRYLIWPFGGAFFLLAAIQFMLAEVDHLILHPLGLPLEVEPRLLFTYTYDAPEGAAEGHPSKHLHLAPWAVPATIGLGLVLFGVLHHAGFRRRALALLGQAGHALIALVTEVPAWLWDLPAFKAIRLSRPGVLAWRFLLKPILWAAGPTLLLPLVGVTGATAWLIGGILALALSAFLNSRLGRDAEELVTDGLTHWWRQVRVNFFPELIRAISDFFRWALDGFERVIYAVDEWLRFRRGEGPGRLWLKAALSVPWVLLTYVLRFVVIILLEPQVNPVKHFPTVTVAHKLLLPTIPAFAATMAALLPVAPELAGTLAVVTIFSIPGLFGFLVWELKENWRLYRANQAPALRPVMVGAHGETVVGLLLPGFHSGTLPKLFRRLRKAGRRALGSGDWAKFRRLREGLHHVEEEVHHFVERELIHLLAGSKAWGGVPLHVGTVQLASNRIRVELCSADLGEAGLWLAFELQGGLLVASLWRPGWLADLNPDQRKALALGLLGLYKLAGVTWVREQLHAAMGLELAYDVTPTGLVVWTADTFGGEARYDFTAAPTAAPRVVRGLFPHHLGELSVVPLRLGSVAVTWERWFEAWEQDQVGKGLPEELVQGVRVLPG